MEMVYPISVCSVLFRSKAAVDPNGESFARLGQLTNVCLDTVSSGAIVSWLADRHCDP